MAIICDIDDTLLRNGSQPIRQHIDALNELARNNPIILVTGRNANDRAKTERQLKAAGVRYNRLIMNPNNSDDNEFKYQTAKNLKQSGVRISFAIDNNEDARNAYRRAGVKAYSESNIPQAIKYWNLV